MDFKNVAMVVNFDFPQTVKNYMHRVGRTARWRSLLCERAFVMTFLGAEPLAQHCHWYQERQRRHACRSSRNIRLKRRQRFEAPSSVQISCSLFLQSQVTTNPEPSITPLEIRLNDIEGFRYRVESVLKNVTRRSNLFN